MFACEVNYEEAPICIYYIAIRILFYSPLLLVEGDLYWTKLDELKNPCIVVVTVERLLV